MNGSGVVRCIEVSRYKASTIRVGDTLLMACTYPIVESGFLLLSTAKL